MRKRALAIGNEIEIPIDQTDTRKSLLDHAERLQQCVLDYQVAVEPLKEIAK